MFYLLENVESDSEACFKLVKPTKNPAFSIPRHLTVSILKAEAICPGISRKPALVSVVTAFSPILLLLSNI